MGQYSLKEKLEKNIWITRKCRINASERLLSHAKFIETLNVYYSILIILVSLISCIEKDDTLSTISLALSIGLTISIIYANATSYRERAAELKQNYIELQLLLDRLSFIKDDEKEETLAIGQKYGEMLKATENHLPFDWLCAKFNDKENMSCSEKIFYGWHMFCRYLCRTVLILLPIAAIILYFIWRDK